MAPPTNSEGFFEAVTDDGTVVGTGRSDSGWVHFVYGDDHENSVKLPLAEFDATWPALPQSKTLTLRAAENPPPEPFGV